MEKLFISLIILIFPFFLSAQEKIYKVAVVKNWEPYYLINKSGKPEGYAIDLFEKVAKSIDLKYEYIIVNNFAEALSLFKEEKADIMPNIGIVQKRENLFLFTQKTDSFYINLYKRKDSNFKKIKNLKNRKIGVIKTNVCNELINDKLTSNKLYFNNYKQMITALINKQIDSFCYPKPLIDNFLTDKIVAFPHSLKEVERGVGVAKNQFNLLPKLNEAITQMKLSGEYEKVYNKWFEEKSFLKLTKIETVFIVVSSIGFSLTVLIIVFFILSEKKWLVTKDTLEEEIRKKTRLLELQNNRLKRMYKRLKEHSNKDPLTKIYNRKFYNEKIKELLFSYERYKITFSFIMFDIDDFKKINDKYGHITGDKVLIELSRLVNNHIRINDYFFRVGGEEFVILLPATSLKEANDVALKIKNLISTEINILKKQTITVSVGLTQVREEDEEESICKRADNNLYKAKENGKNRVVC